MKATKAFAAIALLAVMTGNVAAKEWTIKVVEEKNGKLETVEERKTCSYHEALKIGKTAVATNPHGYFRMTGVDNKTACPSKARKPKAEETSN